MPIEKEIKRTQNSIHVALPYPEESVPKSVSGSVFMLRNFLAVRRKSSRRVTTAAQPEIDATSNDRKASRNSTANIPAGLNEASRRRERRKPKPPTDSPENKARAVESWLIVCPCHLTKRSLPNCDTSGVQKNMRVKGTDLFLIK